MQGNNPVFSRTEGFSGRQAGVDLATPRADQLEDMYAAPSATPVQTGRMTYDDVVMKTGITFGVLLVGAVVG
ncbi:MAG: Bax inhibitor-1/YccA family protein, partial [Jiangellaceae bacterium]